MKTIILIATILIAISCEKPTEEPKKVQDIINVEPSNDYIIYTHANLANKTYVNGVWVNGTTNPYTDTLTLFSGDTLNLKVTDNYSTGRGCVYSIVHDGDTLVSSNCNCLGLETTLIIP